MTFSCPDCSAPVRTYMMIPTDKGRLAFLGVCKQCLILYGDTRTCKAITAVEFEVWSALMDIPDMIAIKEKKQ